MIHTLFSEQLAVNSYQFKIEIDSQLEKKSIAKRNGLLKLNSLNTANYSLLTAN